MSSTNGSVNWKGGWISYGSKRLEAITGERAVYMAMPTCAFRVGEYEVSKTGEITPTPSEDIVDALARAGFTADGEAVDEETHLALLPGML